ncbi:MAG: hypothetical protein WC352_00465 [Candidatus Omnitrophota bacterium]
MKNLRRLTFLCAFALPFAFPTPAYASAGQILHGFGKTVFSVFQLPMTMARHVQTVTFPISLISGPVAGTYRAVTGTAAGALEMAVGAAPYAKYAVLFL